MISFEAPLFKSAAKAAEALRLKRISSIELTTDVLSRIARHNKMLNAIVTIDPEFARNQAIQADIALAGPSPHPPLLGIPCSVKDAFKVSGMRTTAGSPSLSEYTPTDDAEVVRRLRTAGSLIVGKSNMPSMGTDWQTYNSLFGRTNNPWDLSRTPGGSSGGAAATIAAGLEYVTIGSDFGGSVRGPAHFCGIYGHRPSVNLVSMRGHIPPPPQLPPFEYEMLRTPGILGRDPEDLLLLLKILGGTDGDSAKAYRWVLPPARRSRFRDYRVGFILDDPCCPVSSDVRSVLAQAIHDLTKAGLRLRHGWPEGVCPEKQRNTAEYLSATQTKLVLDPHQLASLRRKARQSDGGIAQIFARALTDPIAWYQLALVERSAARQAWREFFKTFDAFLMPVAFTAAFLHDHSLPQDKRQVNTVDGTRNYLDLTFWTSFVTLTGLPATVAPVGITRDGMPVGIQIIGPYLEDATPIDMAAHMNNVIGGIAMPPFRPESVIPDHPPADQPPRSLQNGK